MAHVTIVNPASVKGLTVSDMEHGQCFVTKDYKGDNFYMCVNPTYFANSSAYKPKAAAGKVLVISMSSGTLRMIPGEDAVTPFATVEMKPVL